jgi:hypothetical protein
VRDATARPALGILLLMSLPPALWAGAETQPRVTLTPARIEMGSFYNGARVRIGVVVNDGSKAIVVVRGADRHESFNTKGRFGFIWLNSGRVRISGAPALFLCFSPEPVSALLDQDAIRQRLLDEESIQARLQIEPVQAPSRAARIRSDFLALKAADGLYRAYAGELKTGAPAPGGAAFSAEFAWPKMAPPATYTVQILECRNRAVIAERSIPLEVVKVGFPRDFAVLASQYAAFYGVLAVVAAALAGFAIDFVASRLFGRKRGAAH